MSLKITLEVDGQTEQQLAPLVSRWVVPPPEQPNSQEVVPPTHLNNVYSDNSALRQKIQQLVAQNQLLQAQLNDRQQRFACAPEGQKQLPSTGSRSYKRSSQKSTRSEYREIDSAAPPLPVQYRTARSSRLGRSLGQLSIWLRHQAKSRWKGLLLFLLLCAGMYGALSISSKFIGQAPPEFAGEEPGEAIDPASGEGPKTEQPALPPLPPTSKAGSHPPPPPAFEQP